MSNDSSRDRQSLGLDLLSGADSFIKDLSPEIEASISGGTRSCCSNSRGFTNSRCRRRTRRSGSRSRGY